MIYDVVRAIIFNHITVQTKSETNGEFGIFT